MPAALAQPFDLQHRDLHHLYRAIDDALEVVRRVLAERRAQAAGKQA